MFGLRLGSPKKSLQTLLSCGLDVPEELPQNILSFGKKALKPLAAIMLDKKLHNAEWPKGWAPIHAMYLLGALGEPDALPYFEKLFSLDLDDGFSDFITEDGPAILAGLGPGAISGIKRLARLKSLDPFNRHVACRALYLLVHKNPALRDEVIAFLRSFLAQGVAEEDDATFISFLASDLAEFRDPGAKEELRRVFEAGLIDEQIVQWGSIEKEYAGQNKYSAVKQDNKNPLVHFSKENLAHLKEINSEDEDAEEEAGSEEDEEEDGGINAPFCLPRDRRAMEKSTWELTKHLRSHEFKSPDDANVYLKKLQASGKLNDPIAPENAPEFAQSLAYDAFGENDPGKKVEMARKAIKIWPDCADGYVILAEETAQSLDEEYRLYKQALEAGERALGKEFFAENTGHFWGMIETRPFMRAKAGLAGCLWMMGEIDQALEHYREMLALNPNDNQGIRYTLASCLGAAAKWDDLKRLFESKDYQDDIGLEWLAMKALSTYALEGESREARRRLQDVLSRNSYFADYFLGNKTLPEELPDHYSPGSQEEAIGCAADVLPAWRKAPGALEWLAKEAGIVKGPKAGRNEPCPCGSGKKFKKCCG